MSIIECKDVDYILEIAKRGNISKAADELYVSQPALTKYLKHLEERLDMELFVHGKRPLTPTAAGAIYIEYAKKIAALKKNMETDLAMLKQGDSILSIGFANNSMRQYIFSSVQEIRLKKSHIRIDMNEMRSAEIEKNLINNFMDIGFITFPSQNDLIGHRVLMREHLLLAVPDTHPLASWGASCYSKEFPIINLDYFREDDFVLREIGSRFRACTDILFSQADFKPRVISTGRSNFSCIEFAEAGNVCCITTKTFISNLKNPESMRFFTAGPKPQDLATGLAYRKDHGLSAPACELVSMIERDITNA